MTADVIASTAVGDADCRKAFYTSPRGEVSYAGRDKISALLDVCRNHD